MSTLNHVDEKNENPKMVDVAQKAVTLRHAYAQARIRFPKECAQKLREKGFMTKKGAVFTVAQLAGIMGIKATPNLIPLCHTVPLTGSDVELYYEGDDIVVQCRVSCHGRTGVEMEALTGASVAALTVYDMCKALSHDLVIHEVRLMEKSGGKRDFQRSSI